MGFLGKGEELVPADQLEGDAAAQEKKNLSELEMAQSHPQIDPELEKRVVRKMDWRVPPIVALLYLLAFLDRSNIGNARIAGMEDDLDLVGERYDWLLTIFYIAYILFQFQGMMWKILPPHVWATIIVFSWGVVATCQAATTSWAGMMICRFFLGATEAGYGSGVPYLLSFYYLRHELGSRIGIFLSAAPLANTFAGALAFGITSGHAKLASWRLLFLVEGLPTICASAIAFFFLPDSPEKCTFLTAEEKAVAKARDVRQAGEEERHGYLVWGDVWRAFLDPKSWFTALMYFSCNVSFSSLPVFLPTILKEMGFSSINAQGLTAPPYFVSFLFTIFTTWVADRLQQRGLMIVFLSCLGGIGYVLLATCHGVGPRYFGVFLAASGIFPAIANILPWVLNNQGSDTRRGMGIVILNLIGQCGPILGTRVFPKNEGPYYVKGQSICASFMFFNGFLAIGLRYYLAWENKKFDRIHGTTEELRARREADPNAKQFAIAVENYGPGFRNIL